MSEVHSTVSSKLTDVWKGRFGKSSLVIRRQIEGRLLLVSADIVVPQIAIAAAAIVASRFYALGWTFGLWSPVIAVAGAIATVVASLLLCLYDTVGQSPVERFRLRILGATIMPWLGIAFSVIAGLPAFPAVAILALSWIFMVPLSVLAEVVLRKFLIGQSAWGTRSVLIGPNRLTTRLAAYFLAHPELGIHPIGALDSDQTPATDPHPLAYLGSLSNIERIAGAADIAIIALSPEATSLEPSRLPFKRVIFVPDVDGMPVLWMTPRGLGPVPGFEFSNQTNFHMRNSIKRAFDLMIAVPALFICFPLVCILALLIKIVSHGPAFYAQRRVGFRGAPVAILKLRTMHVDAERRLKDLLEQDLDAREEWDQYMKLSQDPRVLPFIGEFLRKTSLDEIPQLWNVVRGDISLVGPRPFPAYHVDRFDPQFQNLRACVKPGLTGLWQVTERSNADLHRQAEIDTFYIRNWSLWLDLYIVIATVPALLTARGAR